MRLRHIEVFYAVYTSGSVTRAAEILNVSQPSVIKVLAHAEQQLGYALFDRVRGKLVPTPEAHRLFNHVSAVNASLDRLRHVAENLRTAERGRIRVAATPALSLDTSLGEIVIALDDGTLISFDASGPWLTHAMDATGAVSVPASATSMATSIPFVGFIRPRATRWSPPRRSNR